LPVTANSLAVAQEQRYPLPLVPAFRAISRTVKQLYDPPILALAVIQPSKVPADHESNVRLPGQRGAAHDDPAPQVERKKSHASERGPSLFVHGVDRIDPLSVVAAETREPRRVHVVFNMHRCHPKMFPSSKPSKGLLNSGASQSGVWLSTLSQVRVDPCTL